MLFINPGVMQVTEFAISNRSRKIYLAVSCVTEERERKRNGKGVERWGSRDEKGEKDGSRGGNGEGEGVDVNKGGRISFRRTAILLAKDRRGKGGGYAATSGIHKEATWRLSVLNSRRWQTDGRTDGQRLHARLDFGISLWNVCCATTTSLRKSRH